MSHLGAQFAAWLVGWLLKYYVLQNLEQLRMLPRIHMDPRTYSYLPTSCIGFWKV